MNTFLSPLSLERETECLKKVAQNDKEAKDELILHNMRLVAHVTKKYAVREDEMEELISNRHYRTIKAVSSSRLITEIVLQPLQSDASKMRF